MEIDPTRLYLPGDMDQKRRDLLLADIAAIPGRLEILVAHGEMHGFVVQASHLDADPIITLYAVNCEAHVSYLPGADLVMSP
ncbi:hypothetical protein COV94_01215, partial [Candidatus Woesearchaeota archaeon CG11_big_fil_rev_8_21_14_0_20_57_5]